MQNTTPLRVYGYPKSWLGIVTPVSMRVAHGNRMLLNVGRKSPLAELVEDDRGVNEEAEEEEAARG